MKFATRFAPPLLGLVLAAGPALSHAQQYGPPQQGPPPGQGYGQGYQQPGPGGWDAPPNEFSEVGRRAFHDGAEAARFDFSQRRPMDFRRNPNFRHPPAPRPLRDDYRNGFQRGYERASDRMLHQGPPPPPPGRGYPR